MKPVQYILKQTVEGVAPFVGAWIETMIYKDYKKLNMSLPSWERGLKRRDRILLCPRVSVAPFVGAWIETAPLVGASS